MARTEGQWKKVGTSLQQVFAGGLNLLISGANRYLNFNQDVGEDGYGIRDNAGVIEVKSSAGSWVAIGTVKFISDLSDATKSSVAPSSPAVGDLWIDIP